MVKGGLGRAVDRTGAVPNVGRDGIPPHHMGQNEFGDRHVWWSPSVWMTFWDGPRRLRDLLQPDDRLSGPHFPLWLPFSTSWEVINPAIPRCPRTGFGLYWNQGRMACDAVYDLLGCPYKQ